MKKTKSYIALFTVIALVPLMLVLSIVNLSFHYTEIRQAFLTKKIEIKQKELLSLASVSDLQLRADIALLHMMIKNLRHRIPPINIQGNFLCADNTEETEGILTGHTNTEITQKCIGHVDLYFWWEVLILTATITTISFWLTQHMCRKHEEEVNKKISDLYLKVCNLSVLPSQTAPVKSPDKVKKRLISYVKDEIITIDTAYIAYIALVNNTVFVCTSQNEVYNLNTTLDDLIKELDNDCFFRANRQYIININAIENIWVYGRNQLRIETKPKSTDPIIISKNKASEFKKWLNQ